MVETLQYWPHTPVSLIPWLFHYEKGQPHTRSGEMARVACTHPMKSLGRCREVEYCTLGWRVSQNRPIYKSTSTIAITEAIKPSYLSPYKPGSPTKSRRISNNQHTNQDRRDSTQPITCYITSSQICLIHQSSNNYYKPSLKVAEEK